MEIFYDGLHFRNDPIFKLKYFLFIRCLIVGK